MNLQPYCRSALLSASPISAVEAGAWSIGVARRADSLRVAHEIDH